MECGREVESDEFEVASDAFEYLAHECEREDCPIETDTNEDNE
jgi:hypothetical protein